MKNSNPHNIPLIEYLKPKNWIILIILGFARLILLLPFRLVLLIGYLIGLLLFWIPSKRSNIAKKNIELCFPELSENEQNTLLRQHFISLGIGFTEVGMVRWKSNSSLKKIIKIEGLEYLREALKKDKGIVLMSAHFTLLEISALIGRQGFVENMPPMVGMYRLGSNPFINRFFRNARLRSVESLVTKFEVKDMIRALKEKKIVWYAADQSFSGKNSIDINFFGQNAQTNSAICRFVDITDCSVLPYFPKRLPNGEGYELTIYPAIETSESNKPKEYLEQLYQILEDHIMDYPEQYYWVHRRFKNDDKTKDPYQF